MSAKSSHCQYEVLPSIEVETGEEAAVNTKFGRPSEIMSHTSATDSLRSRNPLTSATDSLRSRNPLLKSNCLSVSAREFVPGTFLTSFSSSSPSSSPSSSSFSSSSSSSTTATSFSRFHPHTSAATAVGGPCDSNGFSLSASAASFHSTPYSGRGAMTPLSGGSSTAASYNGSSVLNLHSSVNIGYRDIDPNNSTGSNCRGSMGENALLITLPNSACESTAGWNAHALTETTKTLGSITSTESETTFKDNSKVESDVTANSTDGPIGEVKIPPMKEKTKLPKRSAEDVNKSFPDILVILRKHWNICYRCTLFSFCIFLCILSECYMLLI